METRISPCNPEKTPVAIVGHVGVGHVHSHSGFVQDDSAGFAVVGSLMREAARADTRISAVRSEPDGTVEALTYSGGIGRSNARRGLTPSESELMLRVLSMDGLRSQHCAVHAFGRMYGQGVGEAAVALQGAISLAVMDTFHRLAPDRVLVTDGVEPGRIDRSAAMTVRIGDRHVSLLLVINGSEGGIGPDEDNEGNTAFGPKGELMRVFGMEKAETVVVESKAFAPSLSTKIETPTYYVRAQRGMDNLPLAEALVRAAELEGLPCLLATDAMPKSPGALAEKTGAFAEQIIHLAERLKRVDSAADKTEIVAELARLIGEDAGGVTFMSNGLNDEVRSAGVLPDGRAAVLSMLVPQTDITREKIPLLGEQDLRGYRRILERTIRDWGAE